MPRLKNVGQILSITVNLKQLKDLNGVFPNNEVMGRWPILNTYTYIYVKRIQFPALERK